MRGKIKLFQDSSGKSFCIGWVRDTSKGTSKEVFIDLQTIRPDPREYLKKNIVYECDLIVSGKFLKSFTIGDKKFICR